ncbi:MAG: outer membrane beta-barrel protein [Bdellovibrionales bacterium]
MKSAAIWALGLFTVLTVGQPSWAQESTSTMSMDEAAPNSLSDLNLNLNPQLGVSSFEYSRGSTKSGSGISGGVTFEMGQPARKLETGLLILQTERSVKLPKSSEAVDLRSTYLAIPMMAKIRVASLGAQSWYGKFGFLSAFEMNSNRDSATQNYDVMAAIGGGGRFMVTRGTEFLLEATFNRGLIDSLRSANGSSYNQGFLVSAGLSFGL